MTVTFALTVPFLTMALFRLSAIRKRPEAALDPRLFVWVLFTLLYILPYWSAGEEIDHLFTENQYRYFLVLAMASGCAFEIGALHALMKRRAADKPTPSAPTLDGSRYLLAALTVTSVGAAAYLYFIAASGGWVSYYAGHGLGAYEQVSGYVYEMRYFLFAGLLLFLLARKASGPNPLIDAATLATAAYLLFDAWFTNQRGSWIRLVIIFLAAYCYDPKARARSSGRRRSALPLVIVGTIAAGLIVVTPYLRGQTAIGETSLRQQLDAVSALFSDMEKIRTMSAGSTVDEGNELAVAVGSTAARERVGAVDYGRKWLFPILNFIPRAWWPDKPTWHDYSLSTAQTMRESGSWEPAPGAAETGVADAGYRFGRLAPIFWALLGMFLMDRYLRAGRQDAQSLANYACLLIGFIYFVTQNMLPFVNFYLFMWLPIWSVFFVSRETAPHRQHSFSLAQGGWR